MCTHIIWLTQQQLTYYTGNYDTFRKTVAENEVVQMKKYQKEQEDIKVGEGHPDMGGRKGGSRVQYAVAVLHMPSSGQLLVLQLVIVQAVPVQLRCQQPMSWHVVDASAVLEGVCVLPWAAHAAPARVPSTLSLVLSLTLLFLLAASCRLPHPCIPLPQHIKEFIASCGTYANLVKQAKSKQKILDKMYEAGLTKPVVREHTFTFSFPECEKLPPPVLPFHDVSFGYDGNPEGFLYKNLEFGIDCDSRIALVGPNGAGGWRRLGRQGGRKPHVSSGRQTKSSVDGTELQMHACTLCPRVPVV